MSTYEELLARFRGPEGEARLAAGQRRLAELLDRRPLGQQAYVESAVLRDDIEFLLLSLEVAGETAALDRLSRWRDAFYDSELDRRLRDALAPAAFPDPRAEQARAVELDRLRVGPQVAGAELDRCLAAAQQVLNAVAADQRALLTRLGVPAAGSPPHAAFAQLLGRTAAAGTREKLRRGWDLVRARHRDALAGAVDAVVAAQRGTGAVPTGAAVSDAEVDRFLAAYLAGAVEEAARLEHELARLVADATEPLAHTEFVARRRYGGRPAPRLPLPDCLGLAGRHARDLLDVELVIGGDRRSVLVRADGALAGEIVLDLWAGDGPNRTLGLRNRTRWGPVSRTPVTHVRCGFRRPPDGAETITVQNAHSLFHELGHALNHVLLAADLPALSGLESIPAERRESFPLWFEKLLYRPGFSAAPGWRAVKALEARRGYVERGVLAWVDRQVFGPAAGGVTEAWARLDEQYGVARYCSPDDVLAHFAGPVSVARPGTYFGYLWGAADSCREAANPPPRAWFDPLAPSSRPDPEAIFGFYRG